MPAYDPDLTSGSPYYDDYDESKNYLKVLFKPGYPVQARELTQLQTALQAQIERHADAGPHARPACCTRALWSQGCDLD